MSARNLERLTLEQVSALLTFVPADNRDDIERLIRSLVEREIASGTFTRELSLIVDLIDQEGSDVS